LRTQLGERAFLADILELHTKKHALPFARIAGCIFAAPRQ